MLLDTIEKIRSGEIGVERGITVAKLAAQTNESLRVEILADRLLLELGSDVPPTGNLALTA